MKCKLIVSINEVTIRDYTLIEDEGLISVAGSREGISFEYEEDEENPGKHVLVIKGQSLEAILSFLDFTELQVKIIT